MNNPNIHEDLVRLRDELAARAFTDGVVKDSTLAEVVLKINSCLYRGYPRRSVDIQPKVQYNTNTGTKEQDDATVCRNA